MGRILFIGAAIALWAGLVAVPASAESLYFDGTALPSRQGFEYQDRAADDLHPSEADYTIVADANSVNGRVLRFEPSVTNNSAASSYKGHIRLSATTGYTAEVRARLVSGSLPTSESDYVAGLVLGLTERPGSADTSGRAFRIAPNTDSMCIGQSRSCKKLVGVDWSQFHTIRVTVGGDTPATATADVYLDGTLIVSSLSTSNITEYGSHMGFSMGDGGRGDNTDLVIDWDYGWVTNEGRFAPPASPVKLPVREEPSEADGAEQGPLTLIAGGRSDYTIVFSPSADKREEQVARDLQLYLRTISGVSVPRASAGTLPAKAIVVGTVNVPGCRIPGDLGCEEFVIRTVGERLVMRGATPLATQYALFTFLEKLGCRYYAPGREKLPALDTVRVERCDETHRPALEMRHLYNVTAKDSGDWLLKIKAASPVHFTGSHTLYRLVPPKAHFEEHPEFYPIKRGVRDSDWTWLCFTNEDLVKVVADALMNQMNSGSPTAIYAASQGDWYGGCECVRCQSLYETEGKTWSGVLIHFMNKVATIVKQKHPDRRISTFAYMHTEKPPLHVRPADNLVIRLIHWQRCDLHGLTECAPQKEFMEHLRKWNEITAPGNLSIWHYTVNFNAFTMPWPNLYSLAPDIKTYYDHGVRGIFLQGNYAGTVDDWGDLKNYVYAKAMWNPRIDAMATIKDFLNGTFGKASGPMFEYIDLLETATRRADFHCNSIFHDIEHMTYLTPELLEQAEEIFDRAFAAADNDEIRRRIGRAHTGIEYVRLIRPKKLIVEGDLLKPADPRYDYLQMAKEYRGHVGRMSLAEKGHQQQQMQPIEQRNGGKLLVLDNEHLRAVNPVDRPGQRPECAAGANVR